MNKGRWIALLLTVCVFLSCLPGRALAEEITGESTPAATEPASEPTEPPVDPTEPTPDPTEPTVDPTEPTVDPTEPTVDPTEPATDPTEPANPGGSCGPSAVWEYDPQTRTLTISGSGPMEELWPRPWEEFKY